MIMGELGVRNGTVLKSDLVPSSVILLLRSTVFEWLGLFPVEESCQISLGASSEEFASPDQGGMFIHISWFQLISTHLRKHPVI